MTTILMIPHLDAGDRNAWVGDHDLRPLSELGRRQAEALAAELGKRDLRALFASPALRARQTLEPLGRLLGHEVAVTMGLAEKQAREDRPTMVARGWAALRGFAEGADAGLLAAASHGDMIPALVQHLVVGYQLPPVPDITRRGQWFEIEIEEEKAMNLVLNDGPEDFPLVLGHSNTSA